jgi:hypothetical protein
MPRLIILVVFFTVTSQILFGCGFSSRRSVFPGQTAQPVEKLTCPYRRQINSSPVVTFRKNGSWRHTSGSATGQLFILQNGLGVMAANVRASSLVFKYYSYPLASMVLADGKGNVISKFETYASEIGGSSRRPRVKRRNSRKCLQPREFRNASYVFFRMQYCGWRQGFDRSPKESSGCTKLFRGPMVSSLRKETKELTNTLPMEIGNLNIKINQRFKYRGWEGMRFR